MKKFAVILFSATNPLSRVIRVYEAVTPGHVYTPMLKCKELQQYSVESIIEITEEQYRCLNKYP